MEKDEAYYFHQTPEPLCRELIKYVDLQEGDKVLEAFKGEGSFYNSFPDYVEKDWTEILEGRDYKDYTGEIDWVSGVRIDSYHTVWFELHEDLLRMLGRTRQE